MCTDHAPMGRGKGYVDSCQIRGQKGVEGVAKGEGNKDRAQVCTRCQCRGSPGISNETPARFSQVRGCWDLASTTLWERCALLLMRGPVFQTDRATCDDKDERGEFC